MQDYKALERQAKMLGLIGFVPLDVTTISVKLEVRQMYSQCSQYGKRWSCPPGCGTLAEYETHIAQYKTGIFVHTVGVFEDEFDGEGMILAGTQRKEQFTALRDELKKGFPNLPPLGISPIFKQGLVY